MRKFILFITALVICQLAIAQKSATVKKKDRKRDIQMETSYGTILLRLSDSTPLHRDNFIKLVKEHYFDSLLFHRVINRFMIQSGDPNSKRAEAGKPLGEGGPSYTVPAEFRQSLFHKKGVLAAARESDDVNPAKASSASQFYIVQGKVFNESELNTVENSRLKRKIPEAQREVYKTIGGTPHLDQGYTVFGEVIQGIEVVDKIAAVETSKGEDRDRPLVDVRIFKVKLVKRGKKKK